MTYPVFNAKSDVDRLKVVILASLIHQSPRLYDADIRHASIPGEWTADLGVAMFETEGLLRDSLAELVREGWIYRVADAWQLVGPENGRCEHCTTQGCIVCGCPAPSLQNLAEATTR